MNKGAFVSIIIRTCGKPDVLNNALQSIRNQTYPHIEVVIVEDGPNISEQYIRDNFSDLKYIYHSTGRQLGRTKAGNIGLSLATGKYLNFLDEDDVFLENHIEVLARTLTESDADVAFALAEEHQIIVESVEPYVFRVKRKLVRYNYPFNRLLLCYMNYFPIQSIMFTQKIYRLYGGFDEELDLLEDWDLWVRYAMYVDFKKAQTVTSVYYTPYKSDKKKQREIFMHNSTDSIIEKHQKYNIELSVAEINRDMDYILNVFNKKGIWFYLKKIRNYLLYKDI